MTDRNEQGFSSEGQKVQKVARTLADKISESGIGIVSEVYWRKTPGDRPILLILNSARSERVPGSSSSQEKEWKNLLGIRAGIAGGLNEDSEEVRILYAARFLSLPDSGQDIIDGLTDDYERIPIASRN